MENRTGTAVQIKTTTQARASDPALLRGPGTPSGTGAGVRHAMRGLLPNCPRRQAEAPISMHTVLDARRGGSGILPAARALLLLLAVHVSSSWVCEDVPAPIRFDECEALRVLDAALEGGPSRLLGWGEPVFMCSWGGLQCDLRFRVIYLEFDALQLNGTLWRTHQMPSTS